MTKVEYLERKAALMHVAFEELRGLHAAHVEAMRRMPPGEARLIVAERIRNAHRDIARAKADANVAQLKAELAAHEARIAGGTADAFAADEVRFLRIALAQQGASR